MAKSKLFKDTQLAAITEGVAPELPAHKIFCDPFCSDAHMLLTKAASDSEVLSVDSIVCADGLRALQTISESDVERLVKRDWVSSKKTFNRLKASEPKDDVAKAHRFLYCSEFSKGRLCKSWDESTVDAVKNVSEIDVKEAHARLQKVEINCEDFVRAIARSDSKDTLFYMDPGESVDGSALMDALRKMEGKFVLVCDDGFADLNGFSVNRIRKFKTEVTKSGVNRTRGMTQIIATNFGAVNKSAFSDSGFEIDEPELSIEMVDVTKSDGGAHSHLLDRAKKETDLDGPHSHVFMRNTGKEPEFIFTIWDGPHQHKMAKPDSESTKDGGAHFHKVRVFGAFEGFFERSKMLQTEKDGAHSHELFVDRSAEGGIHQHVLEFEGEKLKSLTPGQFAALGLEKRDSDPYAMAPVDGARVREGAIKSRVLEDGSLFIDIWLDNGACSLGWNLADICETEKFADPEEAREIAKRFNVNGDKMFNALTEKSAVLEIGTSDTGIVAIDCDELQTLEKFSYERGLQTAHSREFFLYGEGELRGVLDIIRDRDGIWKACIRKDLSPAVLSERAQLEKWLMPSGFSGLPQSLERIVPDSLRYWEHSGEEALTKRASLASSGLLEGESLAFVNGQIRRVVKSFDLYVPEEDPSDLDSDWIIKRLGDHYSGGTINEAFGDDDSAPSGEVMLHDLCGNEDLSLAVEAAFKSEGDVAVMCEDTEEARDILSKHARPFNFKPECPAHASEVSSLLFATSFPLTKTDSINWAGLSRARAGVKIEWPNIGKKKDDKKKEKTSDKTGEKDEEEDGKKKFPFQKAFDCKLFKANGGEDERFILGIVLQPEDRDSQGDIYSVDTIRESAHQYMIKHQEIGLMHKGEVSEDEVSIVESYLSPATFTVGDQEVKKGAWLLGVKVHCSDLWESVKKGELTGWSIGGVAIRTPES